MSDATTESQAPVKEQAAPVTETMTKPEIIEHLKNIHGLHGLHGYTFRINSRGKLDCKVDKVSLLQAHESLHRVLDTIPMDDRFYTHCTPGQVAHVRQGDGRVVPVRRPFVDHEHASGGLRDAVTDEQRAQARRAQTGERISDKPLPAGERRVLLELVNNDFDSVVADVRTMAADHLGTRRDEIRAEWESRNSELPGFLSRARAIEQEARQKIQEVVAEAERSGIKISNVDWRYFEPQAQHEGYQKALKEAEEDNRKMLDRALLRIQRQRLEAQRRVLLSGVTEESAKILDSVPTAQELMLESGMREAQEAKELPGRD